MPSAEARNAERGPEKPLSVSPRQQASTPGWAASPQAGEDESAAVIKSLSLRDVLL